jgi:hypothetical protein
MMDMCGRKRIRQYFRRRAFLRPAQQITRPTWKVLTTANSQTISFAPGTKAAALAGSGSTLVTANPLDDSLGSDGVVRAAMANSSADASAGTVTIFVSDGAGNFRPQTTANGTPVTIAVGADPPRLRLPLQWRWEPGPRGGEWWIEYRLHPDRRRHVELYQFWGFVGGRWAAAIAVADFNGDGIPDLAIANTATNGSGSFSNATNFTLPPFSISIAGADFDGDGFPDIAIAATGDDVGTLLMRPIRRDKGQSPYWDRFERRW